MPTARIYSGRQQACDNAGWDKEILAIELQGLIDLDFDVELTGFDMAEIDLILDEAREATGAATGRRM